ncbi:MAG: glycosyltransferase [Candidatus Melainabacteria bacterium]|nr:glycosyltransferase [Candidatus Melainabacteria bacterium]
MISLSLYLAVTFLILGMFGLTAVFYNMLKQVDSSKLKDSELPFISVVIPARNEETKIGRLLESLCKQDYPNFEVVVVNDRSTDRTGDIIADYAQKDDRIKLIQGSDAPPGWIGKCNAILHAVSKVSKKGDEQWYIFTDADTYHHPNSLKDAVSYALANNLDLLSFIPVQELGSFPERLVMPVLLSGFLLGDPFHTVNDPDAERAYAYGQYIVCKRTSYEAMGGHESVRDEIVEDHAIARVFKEKGFKIGVADGKSLYSVRMYVDLKSMWLGWTKNLYSLIDSKISNLVFLLFLLNTVVVFPMFELAWVIAEWTQGEINTNLIRLTALVAVQYITLFLWYRQCAEHHKGIDWRHFFLTPFGTMTLTFLYLHSAYLVLFGEEVNWKGRRYVVSTKKTIDPDANAMDKGKLMADASDI